MRKFVLLSLMPLIGITACELTEVEVAGFEDLVVVEAYLQVTLPESVEAPNPQEPRGVVVVLVHRARRGGEPALDATAVTLHSPSESFELAGSRSIEPCVERITGDEEEAFGGDARCFQLELPGGALAPGQDASIDVEFPGGALFSGRTTVPSTFHFIRPEPGGQHCRIPPDTPLSMIWSRSAGAWAYATEAWLENLTGAYGARGVHVPADGLVLQGLSVSAADTTITFPTHFGLFGRLGSDSDFLSSLEDGLPEGVRGHITLTAVDGNHVNWLRGGNFHPSGWVRVPSIIEVTPGDGFRGTGVFGSSVKRMFAFDVGEDDVALDACD